MGDRHAVIKKSIIYSASNQKHRNLQKIKAQTEHTNGNRKYQFFDGKLLETNGNHSRKSSLTLPVIQLNLEHGDESNGNCNRRRILTVSICYCMEQKPKLIKNNHSMSDVKLSKRLAIEWKSMSREERKKF